MVHLEFLKDTPNIELKKPKVRVVNFPNVSANANALISRQKHFWTKQKVFSKQQQTNKDLKKSDKMV